MQVPTVVGGTVLVIERIESQNFVTGVSGWAIFADGSAEFFNVTIRGDFITGTGPPDPHIEILRVPGDRIEFYTGNADETAPGFLRVGEAGGSALVNLQPSITVGVLTPARLLMFNDFNSDFSSFTLQAHRFDFTLPNAGALTIGDDGVSDPFIDTAGVNTPIHLGDTSGYESARMRPDSVLDGAGVAVTNSLTYTGVMAVNSMTLTIPYSPTGRCLVHFGASLANSIAGTLTWTSFTVRDTNSGGTLRYAANDAEAIFFQPHINNAAIGLGRSVLLTGLPTSGTMWLQLQHRVSGNTGTFSRRSLIAVPQP
jgi:hypothetical protein